MKADPSTRCRRCGTVGIVCGRICPTPTLPGDDMAEPGFPSRRKILRDAFCGFGTLALTSLLHDEAARAGDPLAPKPTHLRGARAKAVIFLFMAGGPSHLETFDPKPLLNKLDGKPRPAEFGRAKYQFIQQDARLLGSKRTFRKHGRSGTEVSDLFPHTATCVDDIALLRSCYGDMVVHSA